MPSLTLYGSSVADATLTSACDMASTTGGTETSKTTTVSGGNHFAEVWSLGGSQASQTSIGAPSGKGWVYTGAGNNTFATGNWSASVTASFAVFTSGNILTIRFYRYSSGTYTQIGTINATVTSTAKTTYSFSATSFSSIVFGASDLLYVDLWLTDTTGTGGDNPTIYESTSASTGVANDMQITTSSASSGTVVHKAISVRGLVSATARKDVTFRAKTSATTHKMISFRGNIGLTIHKGISVRGLVSATANHDIVFRSRTSAITHKLIAFRGRIGNTTHKGISVRGRISTTVFHDLSFRGRVSATVHHFVTFRGNVIARNVSGGFTVWANGTGTATIDHFRVTEYPDPSLNLAPVLPRLGSTTVSWNEVLPANTSRTIKTSLDGVNWTDVTSSNGGTIPGITGQSDPTIDYFDSDTSANYTNTAKSGGSASTATYDTTNSRISLVGGSSGLYLYTALSDNDVDLIADMDMSDAGGLVWRYVDTSNYYELGAYDDSSSGGFTNQLRLYKVVAGTRSLIGSASAITWPRSTPGTSPYKRLRVTMLGSTITVYFDGTVMQTATDSAFASGKMGLRNDGGTSRYYQLRLQPVGDYVTGTPAGDIVTAQFVYTQVTLSTTDPSVNPEIQDLTTTANSPSVASGATIPQLHDPSKPFAAFYNAEMDSLAQSSGDYYWSVISNALTLAKRHATPAPWILHSSDLLFTPNVKPTFSADLYRNRQIITNCLDTVQITGEQKIADGIATSWQLAYPLYSAPTITVQGVSKTVGAQGGSGKDFYWQPGSNSISQDSSAATIPSGYILSFDYTGQFYTTVTRNNLAEQAARKAVEGGTGIVEAIEDGKQMLASTATTYADGLLARLSNNDTVEIQVVTRRSGLQKGQVLPVFIPEHNINDAQLLITRVVTTGEQLADGTILYEYTATATNGPSLNRWASALGL